jgi:hypothetical protein
LKKSALFSDEDVLYLRLSYDVLADQVGDLLKAWRGIIFLNPHLRAYDENPTTGEVDTEYAAAVAKRFDRWVLDTANAEYDQALFDYQYESRSAAPSHEEKSDGQETYARTYSRSRPDRFQRSDCRAYEAPPCQEGSFRGDR